MAVPIAAAQHEDHARASCTVRASASRARAARPLERQPDILADQAHDLLTDARCSAGSPVHTTIWISEAVIVIHWPFLLGGWAGHALVRRAGPPELEGHLNGRAAGLLGA